MSENYTQVMSIISMLEKVAEAMKTKNLPREDLNNVLLSIEDLNSALYGVKRLKFQAEYDFGDEASYKLFVGELEALIQIWNSTIIRRSSGKQIDRRFWTVYENFKYLYPDDIYVSVMHTFFSLSEGQRIEYLSLRSRYDFLNNSIDVSEEDYSLIIEHIEMMAENVDKFKWLYEHLEDYRSKYVLLAIVEYWFDFNLGKLHQHTENIYRDYLDLDIIQCDENEVVVDLGAFTGDSVADYVNTFGEYKKIYAYELTPSTFETLKENTAHFDNIILRQKGVSGKHTTLYVDDRKDIAGNRIMEHGDTTVEIVTLDEDIDEKITLIKMDIEGAEKDAIIGAKKHILSDRPKMMISSYHIPADIFDIPLLIWDIREDYKLYMRFNGHNGIWPCDYVLFAV